jgi:hypothetical protein
MSEPNLQVLRGRALKPQREGDIFAMLLPDGQYLFGRVIRANLPIERAPMPTANLVYIYRVRSSRKEPPIADLRPDALLLPPGFINRMPWTRGYFETVANEPLDVDDLLPIHSFRDHLRHRFVDLDGHPQETPIEPVGVWGLMSYRMLDDLISRALGIPEAPL